MCSGHGKRILSVEFFWVGVMRSGEVANPQAPQSRHLLLGTVSFTVCFAAWGLVSAFAPHFRQLLHLSATQTAFLVAVPVLLGSLARIPMGMLTDRFGGRIVFSALMFFESIWKFASPATGTTHISLDFLRLSPPIDSSEILA